VQFTRTPTGLEARRMTVLRSRVHALASMFDMEGADGGEIVAALLVVGVELTASTCGLDPQAAKLQCIGIISEIQPKKAN